MATRTCRICKSQFDPETNGRASCAYHAGFYAGEVKQRFNDPGDNSDGSKVIEHWWCCGALEYDAPGCSSGPHKTYDDPDD
eukprot:CAMPEP_0175921948 /NCGR_PEP_ID=MMETSP0108-20121206/13776_1 /TAXON_ID=195067 ORGANISM="Goniomonas pacifica, Strain CCMP1869" /NCGR_SAMPLE_ID=MMETSP0108 /ASSEMBLY_ACC=CAM_ASM_000204 /LENGTH=80 /DNA_ID=CAMNT_0017244849 /DNA_START=31 /DNA_END=273 /DNA_ORIENTATION=+